MNTQNPGIGGDSGPNRSDGGGNSGSMTTGSANAGESSVSRDAKHLAESLFDSQRSGVARGAGGLAKALRRAGDELEQQDRDNVGRYVDWAAERLDGLASSMRHKSIDGLVADAQDLARRQPALFLGGAILLGFGLARALKSSARRSHESDYSGGRAHRPSDDFPRHDSDPAGGMTVAERPSAPGSTHPNPLDRTPSGADPSVGVALHDRNDRESNTPRGGSL